jgi:hypothetical protein
MASNSSAEYKVIADQIVSPDEDIIVKITGDIYKGSIDEQNRYVTVSDGLTLQILDAHDTYAEFIAEHPTGEPGDLHIVDGVLYAWNNETNEWINSGTLKGDDANFLNVTTNIVPDTDNTHSLGTAEKRFSEMHIGPGTIYITDDVTGDEAGLTVSDGVLQVDGANQLQVGQLKFVDNNIESTSGSTAIEIGQTSSSANLVLKRNTVIDATKTLAVKKILGTTASTDIELGANGDTGDISPKRDIHFEAGHKLKFGTGTRADIEPSLAPYGKQTVCVKTTGGKNDMYWGSCASNGITGGTDYYILATFTTS